MKIVIASDHAGYPLKSIVIKAATELGCDVHDVGCFNEEPVDFPDITRKAADEVLGGRAERGILVCGTGAGAVMAANKIAGIRCALAHETYTAHQAVEHDDANMIAMGNWLVPKALIPDIIRNFIEATFDDTPETVRRVEMLHDMDVRGERV